MQNDVVGHDTETNDCGPSVVFLISGVAQAVPLNVSR